MLREPTMPTDVVVNPKVGDTLVCPGCGYTLHLDASNGWRNDAQGYGCKPYPTTHSDHVVTLMTGADDDADCGREGPA